MPSSLLAYLLLFPLAMSLLLGHYWTRQHLLVFFNARHDLSHDSDLDLEALQARMVFRLIRPLETPPSLSSSDGAKDSLLEHPWDLVALTRPFETRQQSLSYAGRLRHNHRHSHVIEAFHVVPFDAWPIWTRLLNGFLLVKKALLDVTGWLPARPLPSYMMGNEEDAILDENAFCLEDDGNDDDDDDDEEEGERDSKEERYVIEFAKIGERAAAEDVDRTVLYDLFSTLGVGVMEFGYPESKSWDRLLIFEFRDRETMCEMRTSKVFRDLYEKKKKGFEKIYSFSAMKVDSL